MLYNEMDIQDFEVAVETALLEDEVLMDEIMRELEEEATTIMPLYKLCTSEVGATLSDIHLTVYTYDTDIEVYQGIARAFPYDWECGVADYSVYNIDNTTCIDVWCVFDKWRDITI